MSFALVIGIGVVACFAVVAFAVHKKTNVTASMSLLRRSFEFTIDAHDERRGNSRGETYPL
jgi:hypothetical protein